MADIKLPSNPFNFIGGGHQRISFRSFVSYLFFALLVDFFLWWLPGAGTFFILWCRGLYFINDYRTNKMWLATWVNAIAEIFPIIEIWPGCTVFVCVSYGINVAETKKAIEEAEELEKAEKKSELAAKAGGAGAGSAVGTILGEAVAGPVGAAVGSRLGGAVGSRAAGGAVEKGIDGMKPSPRPANDNNQEKKLGALQDRGTAQNQKRNAPGGNAGGGRAGIDARNPTPNAGKQADKKQPEGAKESLPRAANDNEAVPSKPDTQKQPDHKPRVPVFNEGYVPGVANDNEEPAPVADAPKQSGYKARVPIFHKAYVPAETNDNEAPAPLADAPRPFGYKPRVPLFAGAEKKTEKRQADEEVPVDEGSKSEVGGREGREPMRAEETPPSANEGKDEQEKRRNDTAPLQTQDYDALSGRKGATSTSLSIEEVGEAKKIIQKLPPAEAVTIQKVLEKQTLTVEDVLKVRTVVQKGSGENVNLKLKVTSQDNNQEEPKKAA